jgi:hypothetical protein
MEPSFLRYRRRVALLLAALLATLQLAACASETLTPKAHIVRPPSVEGEIRPYVLTYGPYALIVESLREVGIEVQPQLEGSNLMIKAIYGVSRGRTENCGKITSFKYEVLEAGELVLSTTGRGPSGDCPNSVVRQSSRLLASLLLPTDPQPEQRVPVHVPAAKAPADVHRADAPQAEAPPAVAPHAEAPESKAQAGPVLASAATEASTSSPDAERWTAQQICRAFQRAEGSKCIIQTTESYTLARVELRDDAELQKRSEWVERLQTRFCEQTQARGVERSFVEVDVAGTEVMHTECIRGAH